MSIAFEGKIIEGYFHKRVNRFIAEVYIENKLEITHVPNTGRMKEILVKGAKVLVRKVDKQSRKTKFDLLMVYYKDILIAIDSKLPNLLLYQGFINKKIQYFMDYYAVKKEVVFGKSRFDIGLLGNNNNVLIEAKCATLVENKVARFPDAPTKRGTKHINELIEAKRQGFDTGIFFIIQRRDAEVFTPNWKMDYEFSNSLQKAHKEGVVIKAIVCDVNRTKISLKKEIQINFN